MTEHADDHKPKKNAENAGDASEQERRQRSDRRASVLDRRGGLDRRRIEERRRGGRREEDDMHELYVRRGPGIRRSEDRRAAEEGEMTDEQWEFLQAIQRFKQVNSKPFPTWTEVLQVVKLLGYRKVEPSAYDAEEDAGKAEPGKSCDSPKGHCGGCGCGCDDD